MVKKTQTNMKVRKMEVTEEIKQAFGIKDNDILKVENKGRNSYIFLKNGEIIKFKKWNNKNRFIIFCSLKKESI